LFSDEGRHIDHATVHHRKQVGLASQTLRTALALLHAEPGQIWESMHTSKHTNQHTDSKGQTVRWTQSIPGEKVIRV
jgi:hypothetical protein